MIKVALYKVLKKYWWLYFILLIIIIAGMGLQLLPALILRDIVDKHFSNKIFEGVWKLAIYYLSVMATINVTEFIKAIVTTWLGQQTLLEVRNNMAKKLLKLPISYFAKTPVGEVMSRLTTDVGAVNTLFSSGIINALTDTLKIFGLVGSLYILAPQLLWLIAICFPIILFLSNFFRKRILKLEKKVRICISDIYTFIQEWLRGIQTVKAYNLEEQGKTDFQKPLHEHLKNINGISKYDSWFPCVMQTLKAIIIASAVFFSAKNGTAFSIGLSVGTIAAVADLVGRLFSPIEAIAKQFQTIQQAMAGIARIKEFDKIPEEIREEKHQTINLKKGIELNDVYFSYDSKKVLRGINLNIESGKKEVLIGRSGEGKTTLMNLVTGLTSPLKGTVRVCGIDPFALSPKERRKLFGVVPQMPQIFNGSIRDNITLRDESISQEDVIKAVKLVGLDNTIYNMADGYETQLGEGEISLSSGEIQLLSLARAIVLDPHVLLLDEPTSGIDAYTEAKVFDAIRRVSHGRTILSISHRISGIIDTNRVHMIAKGIIIESGSATQLAKSNGWYAAYKRMEDVGWKFTEVIPETS